MMTVFAQRTTLVHAPPADPIRICMAESGKKGNVFASQIVVVERQRRRFVLQAKSVTGLESRGLKFRFGHSSLGFRVQIRV